MSNDNGQDPKITITCSRCNQRFSAPLPKMEIMNTVTNSVIVSNHGKPIRCICGQAFVPVIGAAQVQWGAQAIPDEQVPGTEESRIIKPDLRFMGRS